MLRRRRPPDPLPAAFLRLAERVEAAKEALLAAVPAARRAPFPLASALVTFDRELERARAAAEDWRSAGEVRERCRRAIEEAGRRGERLRQEAPHLDFESLVLVLGEVIAPLDALADAEHALRRSRRR